MDAYEPRVLSDAMRQVAGFSTYDDLGSPYKLNISSRGFYSSPVVGLPQGVAVFLDGVRMNEPEASQINFDLLPMDHIQRIEVLSGNGSLLGRNALGGAINLVTARGTGPDPGQHRAVGRQLRRVPRRGERLRPDHRRASTGTRGGNYNREDGWRDVTGAEEYSGFVNVGKLGQTERHPLPGSVRQLPGPDGGLAAGDDLRVESRLEPERQRLRGSLGVPGRAPGLHSRSAPARPRRTVYFRRHRAERFNANQPDDPDVFGISYNTSFGYTADYRWATLLNDNLALNLRGGVDGSVSRVSIDIFADSVKFGGDRSLTTQVRSPLWDIAPFLMADLTTGPVDVLRRRPVRLRPHPVRESARSDGGYRRHLQPAQSPASA